MQLRLNFNKKFLYENTTIIHLCRGPDEAQRQVRKNMPATFTENERAFRSGKMAGIDLLPSQ